MIPINKPFAFTFRNPNPRARPLKDGMKYVMEIEMLKEEWEEFADMPRQGMVVEVEQARITHLNEETEKPEEEKPYADKPIGPLCREALEATEDPEWQRFLKCKLPVTMERKTTHFAAKAIREWCFVSTRKAIDYSSESARRWGVLKDMFGEWKKRPERIL